MQSQIDKGKYKLISYLMDNIPDVIYFKDKKGRLLLVNKAYARGLGIHPENAAGKTDFDIFPKARAERMARDDELVIRTGKPIIDKIERATRADGVDNYVSTTKIPYYDEKRRVAGLVGITRDITRRMRFEHLKEEKARLQKKLEILNGLNKVKSEFISATSHELRTPLAIIKQLVMLLLQEISGPVNKKQQEILRKTVDNIEHLRKIIDGLLDISRIESGKFTMHYSLVNISDLIKDSAIFFKKLCEERGIALDYRLPAKPVNVFIDAERINQVISNLINNAIRFTEEGGKVEVELKVFEDKIRVGVIDTGIGISRSDLPQLFNKFVQFSKDEGIKRKGLGLGLSIARELVERHSGEIWAESKLGVGSRFYFTLPRIYQLDLLNLQARSKIDSLLNKGVPVYIVNFTIVNYEAFKEATKIATATFLKDLNEIIAIAFKETFLADRARTQIMFKDVCGKKCSIIFSGATEDRVIKFSGAIKRKLRSYFRKNKFINIFLTLGFFSASPQKGPGGARQFSAYIRIKEIHIGLEMRRFKRIPYQGQVQVTLAGNKTEFCQSVDISQGGVCFVSSRLLKTDSLIKLSLELPKTRRLIQITGRVAWIARLLPVSGQTQDRYKIGIEFVRLNNKDRKMLLKELKL